jgi:2,4-dienoyl-CoA reductase-like NADH-dependent reductase (Old Yellow Enzyme family)
MPITAHLSERSLTFVQQTSARNTDRNPSVEISPGGRPRSGGKVEVCTPKTGATTIERRLADAVAFGRMFIANPDFPARIWTGAPLTFDQSTSNGDDAHAYTDYPALHAAAANVA